MLRELTFAVLLLLMAGNSTAVPQSGNVESSANSIAIQVVDKSGNPLEGVVVELFNPAFSRQGSGQKTPAIMDQINKQFAPHILVVQRGDDVSFPNSDSIKHHVYSFSKPKPFQLKLYKDIQPAPIEFDKSGVVALGCNIHDWMVGYVYVADSKFVSRSDKQGKTVFKLPSLVTEAIAYRVWHPLIQQKDLDRREVLNLGDSVIFQLTKKLHPKLENDVDEFSYQ